MNESKQSNPFSPINIEKADAFLAQFIDLKQLLPIKEGLTQEMIEYFNTLKFSSSIYVGPITYLERQKKIEKYRQKKSKRQYIKKNLYECRAITASKRKREKGRFTSNKK